MGNRFFHWLKTIPDGVPDDMVRYYFYWKVFYTLALLAHAFGFFTFAITGVTFMMWFNVFSVAAFAGALLLLHRGYYRTAFWGVNGELITHGIAATICVGPLLGFQNFVFPVAILSYIQPFYSRRFSTVLAVGAMLCGGLTLLYTYDRPPIYALDPFWVSGYLMLLNFIWPGIVLAMVLPFIAASARAEREVQEAYGESESLLLNILPEPIAARLKNTKGMIADDHERVAILFADIVGFTDMSDRLKPSEVVALLNEVFNAIDNLVETHRVEKIKTIGDAYMVVAGLPDPINDPDETIARLALDIQSTVAHFIRPDSGEPVQMRIGVNAGRVVAGVIGQRKFAYDLWGDAVNVAARMEAAGEPGKIQVTEEFAAGLADRFSFEPRGEIEVKGKGRLRTCYLLAVSTAAP